MKGTEQETLHERHNSGNGKTVANPNLEPFKIEIKPDLSSKTSTMCAVARPVACHTAEQGVLTAPHGAR